MSLPIHVRLSLIKRYIWRGQQRLRARTFGHQIRSKMSVPREASEKASPIKSAYKEVAIASVEAFPSFCASLVALSRAWRGLK